MNRKKGDHDNSRDATFRYAERLPHPSLTPWIAAYWEFSAQVGAPPVHNVPPDGCTSLLIPTGGTHAGMLLYSGPWLIPLVVPVSPGHRFVGVRLRPGAAGIVLDVPVAQLRDATVPAALAGGAVGLVMQRELAACVATDTDLDANARAFDAFWMRESRRFVRPDPLVSAVVDALVASHGERLVSEIARAHGCTERTLLRRFRGATAMAPKQFARVRRLLAAAWHVVDGIDQWGRIAAEAGYADHAHLHHEVKGLLGLRPEEFGAHIRRTARDQVNRRIPGAP
ncbi:MAG: helix-turn-helix transcriptional regulator [Gemmatimonadaceae bacterium]|nr:helix-turn-helix transcriptional regulator [Gemmatimonadaceae bacterium]